MRKRLLGVLLAGFVVAGCGTSGGSSGGDQGAPPQEPAPKPPESARKAPAKATEIADKCGILTQQQQQQFGVSKTPYPRDSNGKLGCQYQQGELGHPGWSTFIALGKGSSINKESKKYRSSQPGEIAGYPIATAKRGGTGGCIILADTSDDGFLITNMAQNSGTDAPVDLCEQGQKVTEAALQNIPNA